MKKYYPIMAAGLLIAGVALAGSIKTWSTGETIKSTDLNANFNHIHSTMVGGHGARLTNSDVATNAAIAHSKLATPALVPKAWVYVAPTCTSGTCTRAAFSGVSEVSHIGTGDYAITLTNTPANTNYVVIVTATAATSAIFCSVGTTLDTAAPQFHVVCEKPGGALDTGFSVLVLDDN